MEEFVASRSEPLDFTPEELVHLRVVDAEPFIPANPAAVAALFARRG